MTTVLIVNPTAGNGHAGRVAAAAFDAARQAWGAVERIDTTGPGDAVGIATRAAEAGTERIVVLGGDGTLHEAANGLLRARVADRPPIAVLPAGTGNDYAKMAGTVGRSPHRAVERLRTAAIRRFDVGEAWGEYFINSVGIGFDAEVARAVNGGDLGRGLPAYLRAVARVVRRFDAPELEVAGDHHRFRDRLLLLEIGIGPCVGGGFRLTPRARPDDGLFDVCAIQHSSVPGILLKLPLVMVGQHVRLRHVRSFQATRLSVVSANGPLHAQFDGEIREVSGRMDIRIVPAALPVLVAS
ncbi:MAG TPA: diacylglycerol kinase family protein [Gemmatimonadales bacterium]|nr:diacylglycerol kinase family protein [Gemmatimonadales bacterium]